MFVCVRTEEQFKLMYFSPESKRKARFYMRQLIKLSGRMVILFDHLKLSRLLPTHIRTALCISYM